MRKLLFSVFVILYSTPAFADFKSALKTLFSNNSANKCSPEMIVDQKIEDLPAANVLAFINCSENNKQDDTIQLAIYEGDPAKLISKGLVDRLTNRDFRLHTILLKPEDLKVSDHGRIFQMRAQYKSNKDSTMKEELIVLLERGKEISAVLRGPLEDYPGRGRAFLIISKKKSDGYADVAIKSEFKIEAFRWRGSNYTPMTREEIEPLKE